MRKSTTVWIFFAAAALFFFALISYKTLFGWWTLRVIGFDNQTFNWDPGGAYLGTGISIFSQRYANNTNFPGHPGITLMFLIQIISRVLHWSSMLFGTTVSFESYIAKNLFWIILITKVTISLLYLISSYIVYIFTLELVDKKEVAILAVISYLTTYPVLSYFINISPEPLMIIFTLLSMLFILKYKKYPYRYENGGKKPFMYLGLAALSTACSLGTKMVFAIPLVFWVYLFVLLEKYSIFGNNIKINLVRRFVDSSLYILLLLIFLIPIFWKVDLNNYFKYWFNYLPGSPIYESAKSWGSNVFANMGYLVSFLFMNIIEKGSYVFLPKFNYFGLFIIAELIFLLASIFGIILFWEKEPKKRLIIIWIVAFNFFITFIYIYRTFWNYFMIQIAFLAIFFAYFINYFVNKITDMTKKGKIILSIFVVLFCHSFSIYLFINLKMADMKEYQAWQPYYEALRKVKYNEKIGIINSPGLDKIFGNLLFYMPKESSIRFSKEFSNIFVYLDEKSIETVPEIKSMRFLIDHTPSKTVLMKI